MADWINIPDTALDPDAPLTSELAYGWRDNPIAIADGAVGAPRNHPASLDIYKGTRSLSGTSPQQYLDLDRCAAVRVDLGMIGGSTAVSQILEASYSNNNGSSWGSYQSLVVFSSGGATVGDTLDFAGMVRVNMATGAYIGIGTASNRGGSDRSPIGQVVSGTHTVPAGCNAVRFRMSAGTGTAVMDMVATSGIPG